MPVAKTAIELLTGLDADNSSVIGGGWVDRSMLVERVRGALIEPFPV